MDELALHPTVKPVAMIVDAIKDVSRRGSVVLDLFGGSGSTLIAAHKTGRRARLCELDPLYCDRILQRWETFAKDDAELIACGVSDWPANDQRVDNRAIEEEASEGATGKIPIVARRKPAATAGDGDWAAGTDAATSHGGSFGSRRPRRACSF
jgi:DNA methylase